MVEANKKAAELRDVRAVRHIANRQVLDGVSYLTRHLLSTGNRESLSNAELFRLLADPKNLDSVGRQCLVSALGGTVGDGMAGIGGDFQQLWMLDAFNVKHGSEMLNDVIVKYGQVIEPRLILKINAVLNDDFFVHKFGLDASRQYLDLALVETRESIECSGWGYLGLYYFNAVYIEGKQRAPDYKTFNEFVAKLHALVSYTSENETMHVFLGSHA